jgi:hypothetical protein
MKNREALQVAIAVLSADIDDLIMASNAFAREGGTAYQKAFDALGTVCTMTQARSKLRQMLEKVEREQ